MRAVTAGVTLVIVLGVLLANEPAIGRSQVGRAVFQSLSWMMFFFSLVLGTWLTHDCLSGERREGTLGLLFLTDLRALDVVLGKLASAGLTAVYAVLAIVPPLSVTLMVGGVTGGEVLRSGVALVNALFAGMALALWVSSRQEDESRSLTLGLGWLIAWVVLPLLPEFLVSGGSYAPERAFVSISSPLVTHVLASNAAYAIGGDRFWSSLLVVHSLGWCFIGMAASRARTCWREGDERSGSGGRKWERVSRRFQAGEDPLRWLATRHLHVRRRAWLAALLMSLPAFTPLLYALWFNPSRAPGLLAAISYSGFLFYLIGIVMFASLVCRPIVEGRQSGLLETLQTTPVRSSVFIEACWRGLRGIVLPPILVAAGLEAGVQILLSQPWYGANISFSFGGWLGVSFELAGSVIFVWALVWTGMWKATSARKPGRAVPLTLLWVMVLPVVTSVASSLLFGFLGFFGGFDAWSHNLLPLAVMVGVWRASEKRVRTRFRQAITQDPLTGREEGSPAPSFGDWMHKARTWQAD